VKVRFKINITVIYMELKVFKEDAIVNLVGKYLLLLRIVKLVVTSV
jgi:hypothetical protein